MKIRDHDSGYGLVSKCLHWAAAGLLVALAALGWAADDLPKTGQSGLMGLHMSLGIGFLGIVSARILWRLWQGWPDFQEREAFLIEKIGRLVHLVLLGLMVLIPLSGWMIVSAAGHDLTFFGLIALPPISPVSHFLEEGAEEVHEVLVTVILFLAGLHVLAALKHRFIDRDGVLQRMTG